MKPIPFEDVRGLPAPALLRRHPERARALVDASLGLGGAPGRLIAQALLPLADRASRDWLERAGNPYRDEIRAIADTMRIDGVYALNLCFEWGCTSGAFVTADGVELRRVLDWLFPRLGEFVVVAHQDGPAGDFHNITWPGLAGVYQGVAAGRFAAAINQAPMRRHGAGLLIDWLRNRILTAKAIALPAAHLLRQVFETAPDYASAKQMLCRTPIALPAIFILAGRDQGCVIERSEADFALREIAGDRVCAVNHFQSRLNDSGRGWRARPIDSAGRAAAAAAMACDPERPFAWFTPPIANVHSRLVMRASIAGESFSVMGTEGDKPVTELLTLRF